MQTEWTETGGLRWPELWPWGNMGRMKIKGKLKANCEGARRTAQIQGTWLFGGLNFATWRQIFSAWFLKPFSLAHKIVLSICAPSTSVSWQWVSHVTPELWVLGMQLDLCHNSSTKNLEMSPRFFKTLYTLGASEGVQVLALICCS